MFRRMLVSAIVIPVLGCTVAPQQHPVGEMTGVEVLFRDPEKFSDVGETYNASAESRRAYLAELEKYIVVRAAPLVKDKQRLVVTISEVDMAGAFEPWRRNLWNTRIVRDIYPPRIDLSFTLTDVDGAVLKAGERKLRDLTFLMSPTLTYLSDPLRYEKKLLLDWLDREFGSAPTHRASGN